MALDFTKVNWDSFKSEDDDGLRANVNEAFKIDPDQHAKVNNLSRESGMPAFAVESDPSAVERDLTIKKVDLDGMAERAPKTAKFLSNDFNTTVIAQEDVGEQLLEGIERTFSGLGESIKSGFKTQIEGAKLASVDAQGKRQQFMPKLSQLISTDDPEKQAMFRRIDFGGYDTEEEFKQAKQETVDTLLSNLTDIAAQRKELTPGDMNILQEGVRSAFESIANMAPGVALAAVTRSRQPLLLSIGAQSYARAYGEGREEGLTPDEAQWFAGIDAAIEVGTEMLPLGTLERMVTGKSTGLKKDALKFMIQEMGTEQLATALGTINQVAFDLDEELKNAESIEEMVAIQARRQAVTAIATVIHGGVQATSVGAINKAVAKLQQTESTKEAQTEVEQNAIDAIADKSAKSKLNERGKEEFKQFIASVDETDANVFIDSVQVSLYLKQKTQSEIESDPALKLLDTQVREAQRLGIDVTVPVADFAGDFAGTEHYTQLREHMTLSDESVSPFRQEQHKEETQAYVRSLLDEATENASEYVEAQEIFTDVRTQLIDTGVVTPANASVMSQVVPAWATAQARSRGVPVAQVYADAGLTIEGPQTGERARLENERDLLTQPIQSVDQLQNVSEDATDLIEELLNNGASVSEDGVVTLYHRTSKENAEKIRNSGVMTPAEDGLFFSTSKTGQAEGFGDEVIEFSVPADQLQLDDIFGDEAHVRIEARANQSNDVSQWLTQPIQSVDQLQSSLKDRHEGLKLSISGEGSTVTLGKIVVPEDQRAAGTGSSVMIDVTTWADANGKTVALSPSADFGGNKNRLKKFYKRFGFIENKGRNKDFEISESMYRPPARPLEQSTDGEAPTARGYYDPQNTVIRLTEAADLSTFLHEFAHFMYEMEVSGNTEMLQSINGWYKRNAEDVAKEANSYLGAEFDELKQSQVEQTETDNFKEWFGESKITDDQGQPLIMYHGTPDASFNSFKEDQFFTNDRGYAERFLSSSTSSSSFSGVTDRNPRVLSVYIKSENPFDTRNPEHAKLLKENFSGVFGEGVLTDENLPDWVEGRDIAEFLREELSSFGFDSVIVDEGRDESGQRPPAYIVFSPEQIKSTENQGTFDPGNPDIFKQSQQPPESKQGSITAEKVVQFLDDNTTGDVQMDAAIRRAVHEQFARGFETYLMEGKAPSVELRNAFRTFARWLAEIYRKVKGDLSVKLDNEMRQVFDRLLATEEQIAAAESRSRIEPMFTDAAMVGMTDQEFSDYQKRQAKVKDVQSETLRDKLIKQLTRQTEAWWKSEKQDIVDEEIDNLKKERVYAAATQLKTGDIKMDRATVKEMVGEQRTDKLGRTFTVIPAKLNGMHKSGQLGMHPDEAAALLGYNSGSEMITDIIDAPPLKEAAEAKAQERMLDLHGDILNDGTIEQQADEAVHSEERGKLILHELKILSRGTNQAAVDRQTIKDIANERIGQLSFREIHPGKYRKAEIKAAQEAARMLAEGNREGAAAAKTRQAVNYYLGIEATKAKNETTKIVDRMARYNKKKVREEIMKAENGYWEQITKILDRFEFRKSATLRQVNQVNQDINTWAKERTEADGDGLVLHNAVLNEGYVTHWKNVAHSDLLGINDSVKNIEHVARYANRMTMMQDEVDFKTLVADWVSHINVQKQRFQSKPEKSRLEDAADTSWRDSGRRFMSQLTKVPFLASWLDGTERAGMSHDVMVQPFVNALHDKLQLLTEVATPVIEAIENRSKEDRKRHARKIWIPEIEDHLTGDQVIAVALNTGNQGNLKKMLLGEGWANPEIEAEISLENQKLQAILQNMTETDWHLVQKIWDQMESLYPQLAEVHRRTTGLVPPKVESTPVATEFGTFKGGYYPVVYSRKRSHKAEKNAEKMDAEVDSMFNNSSSIQSSVNAGSTNERTGFYDRINLSLEVVPQHFNETIHYITHHDQVRQMNKLLQNPQVEDAITKVLGEEEFKQLKPWLNDIAKDGRNAPSKSFIDVTFQRLRFGTTLGLMGFKASTGIMQVFGLLTTASEVGPGKTAKAISTAVGHANWLNAIKRTLGSTDDMQSAWDFAEERSKIMKFRTSTMDREIKNAMERLRGKKGTWAALQETSMKHIALIQTYVVDLPTWHAAYMKGMQQWGDEQRAINFADFSVENLQGSGATMNMATLMRNQSKLQSTFTMFMTFFSALGNLGRDLVRGSRDKVYSPTTVAAKLMFLYTLPVFFEMLMRGEFDEPEDEDTRIQEFATKLALYPIATIPLVRDIANATITDFGYNATPVSSLLEKGLQGTKSLIDAATNDDKEVTKSAAKNASKLVGITFGVPGTSQAWATGEHLYDVFEEGEDFTVRELLFGPKRN